MRVTILGRDFPPVVGGIGDHTDRLAGELARRGAEVAVVCSPPGEPRDTFEVRPVVERWDRYGAIARAVAETKPGVIVWQYNPFAIGRGGVALRAGSLARALARTAPLVLSLHELWFPWGRAGARGLVWAAAQRLQLRGVLRAAARWVVTTERREAELLRVFPRASGRVAVVPIGANIEPGTATAPARAALGIPQNAFVVAHLGSVGAGRDMTNVYDAVRALRAHGLDARLLLAGKTGDFERPSDLNGSVVTTGVVEADALSSALASADCYVHPDLVGPSVGRRGSLAAAYAHGMPVVAYGGPDASPELRDGDNVLLTEPTARSLAHALRYLAENPERSRALGHASRATYDRAFAWDRVGDGFAAVLEGCA